MAATTAVCRKALARVLFFLVNVILVKPSHSVYGIGGGGFRGSILTTADSTLGGGLKLFFPTYKRKLNDNYLSITVITSIIFLSPT